MLAGKNRPWRNVELGAETSIPAAYPDDPVMTGTQIPLPRGSR